MEEVYMKVVTYIDTDKWREFVYEHPHGNIFQTPEMAEVFKRTKNYEPVALAVIDNNEILALLQAVIIHEMGKKFGSLSSRSIIQGGPIFIENREGFEALKLLMKHYDNKIRNRVIYTEIRNMWDTSNISNILASMGYVFEEHLNFLVDLTKPQEELWRNLSRSKRRSIKKAKEKGVKIEEIRDRNLIAILYSLLKETYKNAKVPIADISLFEAAFDILAPKNMLKIFMAKHNETYIGGIVVLIYKNTLYEWYVCGSRNYSKLYPSEIVTWHPIEWGAKNGYSVFDFLGAGKPDKNYGVREFKKRFGGVMVNFGRYKKIYSPLKWLLVRTGFEIYRRIKFKF